MTIAVVVVGSNDTLRLLDKVIRATPWMGWITCRHLPTVITFLCRHGNNNKAHAVVNYKLLLLFVSSRWDIKWIDTKVNDHMEKIGGKLVGFLDSSVERIVH